MRSPLLASLLLASLLLLACDGAGDGDAGTADASPDAGPSCTVLRYDPASGSIERWPEPTLVVEDATTETGLRLRYDAIDRSSPTTSPSSTASA